MPVWVGGIAPDLAVGAEVKVGPFVAAAQADVTLPLLDDPEPKDVPVEREKSFQVLAPNGDPFDPFDHLVLQSA
jgi:hypothetical protein